MEKIYRQRYKSQTLLLYRTVKTVYLTLVHKQSAYSHRVTVEDVSLLIGADMHTVDENLALIYAAPAVLEIESAFSY